MGVIKISRFTFSHLSFLPKLASKPQTWLSRRLPYLNYLFESLGGGRSVSSHHRSRHCLDSLPQSDCWDMTANVVSDGDTQTRVINLCQNKLRTDIHEGNGLSRDISRVVSLSATCLQKGGVIAVPTDTIYGVACLAQNTEAIERIYEIKQRNFQNPVAISVGEIDDIYKWSKVTVPRTILTDLLPGPVTVVFERSPQLNPTLNPHTNLVGIRIPNQLFIQTLAKQCAAPIALTSANVSGSKSCLQVEEFENLWPKLDLVVNGGKLSDTEESRLGSSVVDLSVPGTFRIIRPGSAHKATVACLRNKHRLVEISTSQQDR
ncbi:unnamed protein product [Candidula unifasciata]|uniref:Threonylcarbamoyl-AMP synthase n=1 Tax=Candidula unifasciata TaxID=100452 RepID=A0A8S3Z2G8_9EUPU|nr:unnamed protein product [Candidula unifasciata]